MPKNPEKFKLPNPQPIKVDLTIEEIRRAVERWELKAGQEVAELRRKTPSISPEFEAGVTSLFPRRFPWE